VPWYRMPGIVLAVPAVICTASCGGGSPHPSADNLIRRMEIAVNAARSVHISGSADVRGHAVKIDMSFTRSGGVWGVVTAGPATYHLLVTGGKTYLAPNQAYLRRSGVPARYCPVLCGKYAKISSAPSSLNMTTLFKLNFAKLNPAAMTVDGRQIVNGQPARVLTASDGKAYVAVHGKPFLLRVTGIGGTRGTLNFTQWNAAIIPGPPPASQMVDTSKLPH
jgi:hypothetical protein